MVLLILFENTEININIFYINKKDNYKKAKRVFKYLSN